MRWASPLGGRTPSRLDRSFLDWPDWPGHPLGRAGRIGEDPELLAQRLVAWLAHRNGTAMRAAPVGLAHWQDPARQRTAAVLSALVTHRHPMAVAGALVMATATARLLRHLPGPVDPAGFIRILRAAIAGMEPAPSPDRGHGPQAITLHDWLGELPELVLLSRRRCGAFVLQSLPAALHGFVRTPRDPEATLVLALSAGPDTDTVAAMATTLSGALGGAPCLPARWLERFGSRPELELLAERLVARTNAPGPRPL